MKSRKLTLITKTIVFVAFAIPLQLTAQHTRYTVTDLGTLGGTSSFVFGLNNKGQVSGISNYPTETGTVSSGTTVNMGGIHSCEPCGTS